MVGSFTLFWDPRMAGYDFGPAHPLAPVRVKLTIELAAALGVLGLPSVSVAVPASASDAELSLVHDPAYLQAVMRAAASGFCVYNDPAIAIAWLLQAGASRVAYVDDDVHHGDGVQAAFYDDPRVLTISLHEHPATLFPGTGLASEIGRADGRGYAVNMPVPAFTGDAG